MLNCKISERKIQRMFLWAFLLSLFFFKVPNFYIIPFFKNAFLTTQAIARVLGLIAFIYGVVRNTKSKKPIIVTKTQITVVSLVVLFFCIQSFSVLSVINISSFLSRYKDIVIGIVFFFLFYFYKRERKPIIVVFILSVALNSLYQYSIVFHRQFFIHYIGPFIYDKHLNFILSNLTRDRVYADIYDEIVIPFMAVPLAFKRINNRVVKYFVFIVTTVFSLLSNFRSRILMLMTACFGSVIAFRKVGIKKIVAFILMVLVLGYLANYFLFNTIGFSFYDRLIMNDQSEDVNSISSRITQVQTAFDMAWKTPLGVGLGNFYDNLPNTKTSSIYLFSWMNLEDKGAKEFVHNIFGSVVVESGYISLLVFILLLSLFIRDDLRIIRKGQDFEKAAVIAFWTLFSYGMFNPIVPASYQVLFWGMRGLLL